MAPPHVAVPGLPALTWHGHPAAAGYDAGTGRLSITAHAGTDWFTDPLTEGRTSSAPALLFVPDGDFVLSARVTVGFGGTFDAGVLALRQSDEQWAKLCFERSPQHEAMVVSVVTRGTSDDANAVVVDADHVHLRVLRTGPAYAFHYSLDGDVWHFVRLFRLGQADAPMHAGFLAQAPDGTDCTATFEAIRLTANVPSDLRSGA